MRLKFTCASLLSSSHTPCAPSLLPSLLYCCPPAQAHIWQLDFALSPEALREVNMQMRINEDVLRYVVVKRSLPKLKPPHTLYHRLSEHAGLLRPPTHPASSHSKQQSP